MKKPLSMMAVAILLGGISVSLFSSTAYASPDSLTSSSSDEVVSSDLPEFLSDAEMESLVSGYQNLDEGPLSFAPNDVDGVAARAGAVCTQDTGGVHKRASGGIYLYGTVGSKPAITCVGGPAALLALTSNVYKKSILGWVHVAGAFVSHNTDQASLKQLNVEYVCKNYSLNEYRVLASGTVQYYGGTPKAGAAYSDTPNPVKCG